MHGRGELTRAEPLVGDREVREVRGKAESFLSTFIQKRIHKLRI